MYFYCCWNHSIALAEIQVYHDHLPDDGHNGVGADNRMKYISIFQQLWIGNFVDDHLFISDGYFESLEQLYKGSVKDALKGIKP